MLPGVEAGLVTFVGATTENPFFSVISPLLSRSLLLTLEPLDDDAIRALIERALVDQRGLGGGLALPEESMTHLLRLSAAMPGGRSPRSMRRRARRGRWAATRSIWSCSSRRSTVPRFATTARATSTTT